MNDIYWYIYNYISMCECVEWMRMRWDDIHQPTCTLCNVP